MFFVVCAEDESDFKVYGPFLSQDDATIYLLELKNTTYSCDRHHYVTDKEPPLYHKVYQVVSHRLSDMKPVMDWHDERYIRELAFKGQRLS